MAVSSGDLGRAGFANPKRTTAADEPRPSSSICRLAGVAVAASEEAPRRPPDS